MWGKVEPCGIPLLGELDLFRARIEKKTPWTCPYWMLELCFAAFDHWNFWSDRNVGIAGWQTYPPLEKDPPIVNSVWFVACWQKNVKAAAEGYYGRTQSSEIGRAQRRCVLN